MEDASCLFIGGAEHPDKFERGTVTWERQSRMLNSVQHDFLTMIEFASTFSARTRLGATRQVSARTLGSEILSKPPVKRYKRCKSCIVRIQYMYNVMYSNHLP